MADEDNEQNPWTKPGFVAAAFVVAIIVTLGIVLAVVTATRDDGQEAANPALTSTAPTANPTAAAGGASVCGLNGAELKEARVTTAPAVDEWKYQGTVAYPASKEFGPGATDPAGFRYCFQHSPRGALFAAAYAVTVGTDQAVVPAWIKYVTAPGPYRDRLIKPSAGTNASSDVRLRVAGFRLLAYNGTSARVDVAMVGSVAGRTVSMSAVYPLVWSAGDWKVSTDSPEPGNVASIPDLSGYIAWGE